MSLQNDLNNLTKVKGVTHTNIGTPPPDTSHLLEDSSSGHSITNEGVYHSKVEKKFGTTSLYLNGDSYITVPDSNDWYFAGGDFTIDAWVNLSTLASHNRIVVQGWTGSYYQFYFHSSNGLSFLENSVTVNINEGSISGWQVDTWYHVAVVRSGNNWYLFKDGSVVASTTVSYGLPDVSEPLYIGGDSSSGALFEGYIDSLRILKGTAAWTTSFTPPTLAHDLTDSPVLLLNSDNADFLNDYDVWWDADNKDFRVWKDRKWVNDYGYGYSCTGISYISSIERIEFPFDSGIAAIVGNLNQTTVYRSCCNSSVHGYILGGEYAGQFSTIERVTFPFNSGLASIIGNISDEKRFTTSCNSSIHGYISGGFNGSARISIIDRILFPHNSGVAINVGNLTSIVNVSTSYNSSVHGFSTGGHTGTIWLSSIDRIEFPFDSGTASNVGSLAMSKYSPCNCNSSVHGFCSGGVNSSSQRVSNVERVSFPFNSGISSNVGNLSATISNAGGCNSTNYGYCISGNNTSNIDRISFPFDSGIATTVGSLTELRNYNQCFDNTDFVSQFI